MFSIRAMTLDDYDTVIELMSATPGISLREADSRESTARYLARNPAMSFVAEIGRGVCGCVMCGHDGRRGYLQHLLVLPQYRRQGIAKALVERCLASLEAVGIHKCHLDVFKTNLAAARYWQSQGWQSQGWQSQGWQLRSDIDRYSFTRAGNDNA